MPSNKTLGKWAMAREKRKLVLNVTPDIREWVEKQAGERRMTMSEYCMRLMTRGIRAEETDQAVERLREVYSAPALEAVMMEMLALRYMVQRLAEKSGVSMPITLGSDANEHARRELKRREEAAQRAQEKK